jgi:pSer/pThr/pTyr-binding forkhead associated (FHA) protein
MMTSNDSQRLPTELVNSQEENDTEFKMLLGNALFNEQACLVLQVANSDTPLSLKPGKETYFGRFDPNALEPSQVDLSPYGGRKKGVSRLHAVIHRSRHTLSLSDLGSSNGTFLNGERLRPQQSRVLRDGDEVRFGELAAKIFYR